MVPQVRHVGFIVSPYGTADTPTLFVAEQMDITQTEHFIAPHKLDISYDLRNTHLHHHGRPTQTHKLFTNPQTNTTNNHHHG